MLAADATPAPTVSATAPAPVTLTPAQVFAQQQPQTKPATVAMVLGTVAVVGAMFGISALHGQWAYGDWTCAFKNCVAVAPVRRRRKR
jgi:hypothetical protein